MRTALMKQTRRHSPAARPSAMLARPALFAAVMAAGLTGCDTPGLLGTKSSSAPVSAPAPAVHAPAPAPAPVEPPPPPTLSAAAVQKLVTGAIELLEAGNEDQASADLQRALQSDPNHRLAQQLLKQISADPLATLGRESFIYRVQPGETLSRIAQRFLGDVHQFYILARYNDIKVPRQLAGGQVIRVPGKAPPAGSLAPATGAAARPAAPAASAPAAVVPVVQTRAPAPVVDTAERDKAQAVLRLTRAARAAFAKQDLTTAIKNWDQVLELDPNNNTAKLERQKALDLKERLGKVK